MLRLNITCFLLFLGTRVTHATEACPNLFEPENGKLEVTSHYNMHLSSASFVCDAGYQIHGPIKLGCSGGEWFGSTTMATNCVSKDNSAPSCDSPIANNNYADDYHYLTMQGTFANGGKVHLECLPVDGFVNIPENQILTCMDGIWDLPPITCLGPPIPTDSPMIDSPSEPDSNLLLYVIVGVAVIALLGILCGVGVCTLRRPKRSQPHTYATPAQDPSYDNAGLSEGGYEMVAGVNNPVTTRYEIGLPKPVGYISEHDYHYVTPLTPTIPLTDVEIDEEIGKDRGVSLCKGTVRLPGSTRSQDVVVKVSRADFTRNQMASLRREIDQLRNLTPHQNLISTVAIISSDQNDCIGIVSEYATKGSLREILRKRKTVVSDYSKLVYQVLTYVKDIAKGMRYLHTQKFLQPNLKAGKVLVFSNGVCKISNFGLKQLSTDGTVYDLDQPVEKLRPSWFAPEVIMDKVVSNESDIWTFGATLYEIFSFGEDPFEGLSDKDVVKTLSIDKNSSQALQPIFQTPPELCKYPSTQDMFTLICQCCRWKPSKRPGFKVILQRIETALVAAKN